jgi:antitoxin (DNA-binding transcriptional repressor) of toxin-antitoxin stability system
MQIALPTNTISATDFVRQCKSVLNALPSVGEIVIARHKTQIARLVAVNPQNAVMAFTAAQVVDDHYGHTPDADGAWASVVRGARGADALRDPWLS